MTATPARALLLNVAENPGEWDRLMVLADWHDERGDPTEALGWRLLAGQRRWPHPKVRGVNGCWWTNEDVRHGPLRGSGPDPEHFLPKTVFALLGGGALTAGTLIAGAFRDYGGSDHVPAALADAARAYGLAWLAGWRPAP